MRKTKILIVSLLAFIPATATFAQSTKIKDVRTNPDFFFLQDGQQPSSLAILPPPPSAGSMQWFYDESQYQWGKSLRDTPRGDQAATDAQIEGDGVPHIFSEAFGTEISKKNAPEVYKLVLEMRDDAGDLATRSAKNHYMRIRPFAYYKENTCNPTQQKELSGNGSYPSGHTAIGWAEALVLAEINVDRQNEILKRGYEMGQSRVICGYHWQSDVDAGRLCGAAVVVRLHADPAFQKQLQKAKKEFAQLVKVGKVAKGTFIPSK
jgi:acid phosphatase (class A)